MLFRKAYNLALLTIFLTVGISPALFRFHTESAQARSLAYRLKGRILLQVERRGEAWYVNPQNEERYSMGRPSDAFDLMRGLGLGITESDFLSFNGQAPARLSGRILLQVEKNGEAWYVNPLNLKMHYLGRPADAFQIMKTLGLGIADSDLEGIGINGENPVEQPNQCNTCSYECNKPGLTECDGERTIRTCGNYDNDPCFEWGIEEVCTQNEYCRSDDTQCMPRQDCHQNHFKTAFVLVVDDISKANSDRLNLLNNIKTKFKEYFHTATRGLATMDVQDSTYVILEEPGFRQEDTGALSNSKVTRKMYQTAPDIYDFVAVFDTLSDENRSRAAGYARLKNTLSGIGDYFQSMSYPYGSLKDKLLGIINMDNTIERNKPVVDPDFVEYQEEAWKLFYKSKAEDLARTLVHEVGHQWCCDVGDAFLRNKNEFQLEIINRSSHWYSGLDTMPGTKKIMGVSNRPWINNGDGTYRLDLKSENLARQYHNFQLYFMGLLPEEEWPRKFNVYDVGIMGKEEFNTTNAEVYNQLSIYDIISVEGERLCE